MEDKKSIPILNNDPYTANTPRVYTVWDASNRLAPEDKVILLSDHKEVVNELAQYRGYLKKAIERSAKLEDALKVCKNQRDSYALMVTPPTERNELWKNLNAALDAILQEAK